MGIFITSTGTGIGKTTLTSSLLTWDRAHEQRFTASKPIITGWPESTPDIQQTDTGILLQAQGLPSNAENIQACTPWRFPDPLTPDMAARKAGRSIDISELLSYSREKILRAQQHQQIHLMEGVGGIMSPIWGNFTNLEWIKALECPCILVVGSYLGTLSHTLTAVAVLQQHGIPILAVVIDETPGSTVDFEDTCTYLATLLPALKIIPQNATAALYYVTTTAFSGKIPAPSVTI
jgi:dethiobiotin synthetase